MLDRALTSVNSLVRRGRVWQDSRSDSVWTGGDDARLLAVASPPMATAFMLALWPGQRQGDLPRLAWDAYDGAYIRLKQSKTGVRVRVPVATPLKAHLDSLPRKSSAVIRSEDDRPSASDGFRAIWRNTCERANIKDLTFHDPRGTLISRLARAGTSEIETATLTGHAVSGVKSIIDKFYHNRDPALAASAIKKLEAAAKSTNELQTGT